MTGRRMTRREEVKQQLADCIMYTVSKTPDTTRRA
jgi:hypothetical protein